MFNTLLSGHRGTTFFNTFLNLAYVTLIKRNVAILYPGNYFPQYSKHNGDDVI